MFPEARLIVNCSWRVHDGASLLASSSMPGVEREDVHRIVREAIIDRQLETVSCAPVPLCDLSFRFKGGTTLDVLCDIFESDSDADPLFRLEYGSMVFDAKMGQIFHVDV